MQLKDLEDFLQQESIPVIKNKIGFLEIIKKQHYENINSNIYAHFLSCEIPEIRSAFLDSLLALIAQKSGKHLLFGNTIVNTEIPTTGNGRIDMAIEDFSQQSAIIIENKIYHYLSNDLLDYWNHYKIEEAKKVGILLTLYPHEIYAEVRNKFINITHLEWITAVKENFSRESIPMNYSVYVDDFMNTIENITRTNTMNESAKFFFEHAAQINQANETLRQGHLFLDNQYQLIAQKIGWKTYGSDIGWKNFWDEQNHLDTYLTIVTRELIAGKSLSFMLILELNRKDKERIEDIIAKFKNHPQWLGKSRGKSEGTYVHLLCQNYSITIDQLAHLSDIVVEKIKSDFAAITIEVIKYLYPEVNISTFEQSVVQEVL